MTECDRIFETEIFPGEEHKPRVVVIVLRWIVFLPVAFVLIVVAQLVTMLLSEMMSWWNFVPLILIFGALISFSSVVPVRIAPHRVVGAAILLTIFVLLEAIALVSSFSSMSTYSFVVRLYVDVLVIVGAVAGARYGMETR